jgi:hypothetical protein
VSRSLEALAVRRAEEQLATLDLAAEVGRHDCWAIKPGDVIGRDRKRKPRQCFACERKATHDGGYCHKHWKQVSQGRPVDCDRLPTEREVARMTRILLALEGRPGTFVPYPRAASAPSPGSAGSGSGGGMT